MLQQVTWDDPDVVQTMMNVSPWQVERVSLPEHPEVSAAKKCKISVDSGFLLDRDGELTSGKCKISKDVGLQPQGNGEVCPMTGSSNSVVKHFNAQMNPLLMNSSSPAGVQGARPDQIRVSDDTHQTGGAYSVGNMSPIAESVSTEVNTGDAQLSNLSSDPPTEIQFLGNEVAGSRVCTGSPKVGVSSFQLFGKIIHMN